MQNRKFNLKKNVNKRKIVTKIKAWQLFLEIKIQEQLFYFCIFACGGSMQKPGSRN